VTYHLQVENSRRLIDLAREVSCEPVSDSAEAVAALYEDQMWMPSENTGLVYLIGGCGGGFGRTGAAEPGR